MTTYVHSSHRKAVSKEAHRLEFSGRVPQMLYRIEAQRGLVTLS